MQFFLLILAIPFFYINYKIIKSDITLKRIPNKSLLNLLSIIPFYYLYLLFSPLSFSVTTFAIQIFVALVVSFLLFYFWIWSPWDAKYLLVLALFIPQIWIVPFIGNIALLALLYLLAYYIYFYFWKCLFDWKYGKSLYQSIYIDLKEKIFISLKYKDGNMYKKRIILLRISKWVLLFLTAFVSIRLIRLYIFLEIKKSVSYTTILKYISTYTSYSFLWFFIISFWIAYWMKFFLNHWKTILKKVTWIKNEFYLEHIMIWISSCMLISFIVYEYQKNPKEMQTFLVKIFTFYIAFYIIFLIVRYSYKIAFQLAEQDMIHINNLNKWDIVDIPFLKKYLSFYTENKWGNGNLKEEVAKFISNIENPIDEETSQKLKEIYKKYNIYNKETTSFTEQNHIQTLKTFSFWGYIFAWFILTIISQHNLSPLFIENGIKIFFGLFKG